MCGTRRTRNIAFALLAVFAIPPALAGKPLPFFGDWHGFRETSGPEPFITGNLVVRFRQDTLTTIDLSKNKEKHQAVRYFVATDAEHPRYAVVVEDDDDVMLLELDGTDILRVYDGGKMKRGPKAILLRVNKANLELLPKTLDKPAD